MRSWPKLNTRNPLTDVLRKIGVILSGGWLRPLVPKSAATGSPGFRFSPRRLNIFSLLALAGVLGPIVLATGDLAAAFSYPEYDFLHYSISDLALTPMGWLQTIGFLVNGLLIIGFGAGLYFGIRKRKGFRASITIFLFFGFGMLLMGAFRTDPADVARTVDGTIHLVGAFSVFLLFPLACFLIARSLKSDPRWRKLFRYTVVAGLLAVSLIIVRKAWLPEELSWYGLYERILVANSVIWLEVMAIRLFSLSLRQNKTFYR